MWFAHYDSQSSTTPLIIEPKVSGASCMKEWAAVVEKVGIAAQYETCLCTKKKKKSDLSNWAHTGFCTSSWKGTHMRPLWHAAPKLSLFHNWLYLYTAIYGHHTWHILNNYADLTLFFFTLRMDEPLRQLTCTSESPLRHKVTDVHSHLNMKELRKLYSLCWMTIVLIIFKSLWCIRLDVVLFIFWLQTINAQTHEKTCLNFFRKMNGGIF